MVKKENSKKEKEDYLTNLYRSYDILRVIKFLFNNPQHYYKPGDFLKKLNIRKEQWEQKYRGILYNLGIIKLLGYRPFGEIGHLKRFFTFDKNQFFNLSFDYFMTFLYKQNKTTLDKFESFKKRYTKKIIPLQRKYNGWINEKKPLEKRDYIAKQYLVMENEIFTPIKEIGSIFGNNLKELTIGNYYTKIPKKKKSRNKEKEDKSIIEDNLLNNLTSAFTSLESSIRLPENINRDNIISLYKYLIITIEYILSKETPRNFKELNTQIFSYWARNFESLLKKNQLLFSVDNTIPSMTGFCYANEVIRRQLNELN